LRNLALPLPLPPPLPLLQQQPPSSQTHQHVQPPPHLPALLPPLPGHMVAPDWFNLALCALPKSELGRGKQHVERCVEALRALLGQMRLLGVDCDDVDYDAVDCVHGGNGCTALLHACLTKRVEVVRFLLDEGAEACAEVRCHRPDGRALPLCTGATNPSYLGIEYEAASRWSIDGHFFGRRAGDACLHVAVRSRYAHTLRPKDGAACVLLLLEANANVHAQDLMGCTPLDLALEKLSEAEAEAAIALSSGGRRCPSTDWFATDLDDARTTVEALKLHHASTTRSPPDIFMAIQAAAEKRFGTAEAGGADTRNAAAGTAAIGSALSAFMPPLCDGAVTLGGTPPARTPLAPALDEAAMAGAIAEAMSCPTLAVLQLGLQAAPTAASRAASAPADHRADHRAYAPPLLPPINLPAAPAATAAAPPCHLADGAAPKTQPAPASVEPPPPPLFVEPTATASAAVVSAQRLNSDTTQTSAASPLLPDGTERGRTPPLPQPPQPPMQPLQPPTPMQLPPPGLPPSAAAAPPLPEAPRVLSAKALGKRKIGSW
jgi:ankyrin repeat protein